MKATGNLRVFLCLLIFSLLAFTPSLRGQVNNNDYLDRIGMPSFAPLQTVDSGYVNIPNGNLHLEVPIGSFIQRGGKSLDVKLVYDSRVYQTKPPYAYVDGLSDGGWKVLVGQNEISSTNPNCRGGSCYFGPGSNVYGEDCFDGNGNTIGNYVWYQDWSIELADGTFKRFPGTWTAATYGQYDNCPYWDIPNSSGSADDGSGWYISITNYTNAVVYDNLGNMVWTAGRTVDTNGNYLSVDSQYN